MQVKQTILAALAALLLVSSAPAESVKLGPAQDNTLIQRTDPSGQLSNGLGDIFVGRTNQDGQGPATISIRRGLVQFDLSSIPAGAIITGATLTMREVMGLNGDPVLSLHRILAAWGEDATWLYSYYNAADPALSPTWTTPGGDFTSIASGTSVIFDDLGGGQLFTWSDPGMVADLQFWLDNPIQNFGWLLQGDESRGQSAKRLNSRDSGFPPELAITYKLVPEPASFTLLAIAAIGVFIIGKRR